MSRNIITILCFFSCFLLNNLLAQNTVKMTPKEYWVDSVFNSLSENEKLGQLFNVRVFSDKDAAYEKTIIELLNKYHIGGVTFFKGSPYKQVVITNTLQGKSKVPLMIAMDAEWGLGMRMPEYTISYPKQLTLGAIQDNAAIYDMGFEVARQLKRLGVHMNFAPVIDVNNNPNNPVINDRSFGEDKYNVTTKGYMYMKGMQDNGVLACAKHFPGHGDTDTDSHLDLPIIKHDRNRLDSIELYPFRVMAKQGLASVMVAHLYIPSIDDRPNMATTLSKKAVTDILKNELGFQGLIITDALDMKGVAKFHPSGELEVKALEAGNDVLLLSENLEVSINAIKAALLSKRLSWNDINKSIKKILAAKYDVGLQKFTPIDVNTIDQDINDVKGKLLKNNLIKKAITVVKNDEKILPLITVEKSVACISVGEKELTAFQKMVSKYASSKMYNIGHKEASNNYQQIANNIRGVDTVILALHNLSKSANSNWSISNEEVKFIEQLDKNHHLILVIFGSPYSLKLFPDLSNIVLAYQDERLVQEITAQSLFGVNPMEGRLPVSASSVYPYGTGVSTQALGKIGFDIPENEGLSSIGLNRIDSLVYDAIQKKATPGGQVVVAKNGKIVFSKAYGHHTYSKNKPVQTTDIYDIASITKVAATALSFMKLQQLQQIDVTHKASQYLNFLCGTNKENIVISDMLAHRAQLPGWIPFYKDYVRVNKKGKYIGLAPQAFQRSFSSDYPIEVGDNLFMKTCYIDTIFQKIVNIENRNREGYRYSDLGFILGAEIVKSVTGTTIDKFAAENFYKPLGLQTMGYKPLNRHSLSQIPPTEIDNYFRNQIIQGHVHDMAAAMLGGVSGHAGLFSNAEDLAVLMQLLINDGYYNGQQILDKATVDMFLTRYNDSRRSIGFDMKELDPTAPGRVENMSPLASPNTFGHIGFTGTCVWADRENNLVYVFLSNRTYPNMSNNLLHDNDYRPKIHSIIYESFLTKTETPLMVLIPEGSH